MQKSLDDTPGKIVKLVQENNENFIILNSTVRNFILELIQDPGSRIGLNFNYTVFNRSDFTAENHTFKTWIPSFYSNHWSAYHNLSLLRCAGHFWLVWVVILSTCMFFYLWNLFFIRTESVVNNEKVRVSSR